MTEYSLSWLSKEVLPSFFADVNLIQGSEHNYAALLYHHLLVGGLSCKQVCREMYIEGITRKRPDLVILSPEIAGKFSYYQDGDASKSNTPLKREHVQALIEIKGGCNGKKQALQKIDTLNKDIDKLKEWQMHFSGRGDYIFLAIDLRGFNGPMKEIEINRIGLECRANNSSFIYFRQDSSHFQLWQPDGMKNPMLINVKSDR